MAATQGTVRVHQHDHTVIFRVEGRVTMPHSVPLRLFAERCLAEGATQVLVDLRDCAYMDSTFLGTLLSLKKAADRQPRASLLLISPSDGCRRLFAQMGLTGMFPTQVADPDPSADWQELSCNPSDVGTLKRNVTEAHEQLANLPGPAGEQFRTVQQCLAQAAEGEKKNPPSNTPQPE
jgi:anti-anti-sigma factor